MKGVGNRDVLALTPTLYLQQNIDYRRRARGYEREAFNKSSLLIVHSNWLALHPDEAGVEIAQVSVQQEFTAVGTAGNSCGCDRSNSEL
jgi:hypothetical protein